MLFNSLHFLVFLPITLVVYYLLAHHHRWVWLFVASSYFYMAFYPPYILVLYTIILIDYCCGLQINDSAGLRRRLWLLLSIVANLGILCAFKYFNFFADTLSHFIPGSEVKHLDILLPIGLSFHTFQSLSYTIEVYRGRQQPEKHLGYFANYVLFFPQMVAGPIERYSRLGNELNTVQVLKYENISTGLRLVLYGLFVKMCVADNLAPIVDEVYKDPGTYDAASVWLALFAFAIQIYADFYGYSTVALGAARCMGVNLMDNFKQPYFAKSIRDFWQRWHISLSTWFRDYVFFSMGGSQVGKLRWIFNIVFLFALSGFWHGANYTFIIWGLAHGTLYLFEQMAAGLLKNLNFDFPIIPKVILTFISVTLIWVFFRAESADKAFIVFRQLLNNEGNSLLYRISDTRLLIPVLLFAGIEGAILNSRFDMALEVRSTTIRWGLYSLLFVCIMLFSGIQSYPFIYFQF